MAELHIPLDHLLWNGLNQLTWIDFPSRLLYSLLLLQHTRPAPSTLSICLKITVECVLRVAIMAQLGRLHPPVLSMGLLDIMVHRA